MKVAVAQFEVHPDFLANWDEVQRIANDAHARSADLLILPELSLSGWGSTPEATANLSESLDGRAVSHLAQLSTDLGLPIIGGLYEKSATPRPHNTLVAVAPGEGIVATHRKTHVYDAWGYRESDEVTPGDGDLATLTIGQLKVGLVNCYEIRFPERAYSLALTGVDLIAVSAAWPRGPHRDAHWALNLRARALENTVWIAASGACAPDLVGRSSVIDPFGMVRAQLAEDPGIAVQDVDLERIDHARKSLPVLAQRRERYASPRTAAATSGQLK